MFFRLCVLALVLSLLSACKTETTPSAPKTSPPTKARPSPPLPLSPEDAPLPEIKTPFDPLWLGKTWLSSIQANPDLLKPFLGSDKRGTGTYEDTLALRKNLIPSALTRPADPAKIDDTQRILRTRLHLLLADLYQQNDLLVKELLLETGQRRLLLANKLQLGNLFRYYWGRLLCILDRPAEAIPALEAALQQVPPLRKQRVEVWLSVCRTPKAQRSVLTASLEKRTWDDDPDGLAEVLLLHLLFQIPSQKEIQPTTPRAQLFHAVWKQKRALPPLSFLGEIVDQETIKENNIDATLEYYDPAFSWILARHHAYEAQVYLKSLQASDAYARFAQAEIHLLLDQKAEAKAAFEAFLAKPPTDVSLAWLLFSSRLGPYHLQEEASFSLALLLHPSEPKKALEILDGLTKKGFPSALWSGLARLLLQLPSKPNALLPREAVASFDALLPSFEKKLRSNGPGAAILDRLLRIDRALRRPVYSLASLLALSLRLGDLASRWMEILHQKNEPYTIGGENQPGQILLTSRAYMLAGRLENSNLFFDRNRKLYPILTQPWALMRMLRIFRGMGGSAIGPKSGG